MAEINPLVVESLVLNRPTSEGMVNRGAASRLISLYGHLAKIRLSGDEIGNALKSAGLIEWVSFKGSGLPDRYRETAEFSALDPEQKLARVREALYRSGHE